MKPHARQTNPKQKEEAERIQQQRADLVLAVKRVFDSPDGERVLAALHSACGLPTPAGGRGIPAFQPAAGGGAIDPYAAALREGRRSLLWDLLNWKNSDPAGPVS